MLEKKVCYMSILPCLFYKEQIFCALPSVNACGQMNVLCGKEKMRKNLNFRKESLLIWKMITAFMLMLLNSI